MGTGAQEILIRACQGLRHKKLVGFVPKPIAIVTLPPDGVERSMAARAQVLLLVIEPGLQQL